MVYPLQRALVQLLLIFAISIAFSRGSSYFSCPSPFRIWHIRERRIYLTSTYWTCWTEVSIAAVGNQLPQTFSTFSMRMAGLFSAQSGVVIFSTEPTDIEKLCDTGTVIELFKAKNINVRGRPFRLRKGDGVKLTILDTESVRSLAEGKISLEFLSKEISIQPIQQWVLLDVECDILSGITMQLYLEKLLNLKPEQLRVSIENPKLVKLRIVAPDGVALKQRLLGMSGHECMVGGVRTVISGRDSVRRSGGKGVEPQFVSRLERLERRVDVQESTIQSTKKDVSAIKGTVNENRKLLGKFTDRVNSLEQNIAQRVGTRVQNTVGLEISRLHKDMASIRTEQQKFFTQMRSLFTVLQNGRPNGGQNTE